MRRAFKCHEKSTDLVAIYLAESRGAAKFQMWRAAKEAGFDIGFGDIRAVRAKEFDRMPEICDGWKPQDIKTSFRFEEGVP